MNTVIPSPPPHFFAPPAPPMPRSVWVVGISFYADTDRLDAAGRPVKEVRYKYLREYMWDPKATTGPNLVLRLGELDDAHEFETHDAALSASNIAMVHRAAWTTWVEEVELED